MTRKDFEALSTALRHGKPIAHGPERVQWVRDCANVACALANLDRAFHVRRFLADCGIGS